MTNGPKLCSVPQMARAERMKMPVAVSRWVKAESGPDHDRSADERDRIIFGGDRKPTAKNNFAESKQQESKEDDLKSFRAVPAPGRCDKPKNDQGREHEPAGDIAEPPRDPDGP